MESISYEKPLLKGDWERVQVTYTESLTSVHMELLEIMDLLNIWYPGYTGASFAVESQATVITYT